jgi:hypothetical protein
MKKSEIKRKEKKNRKGKYIKKKRKKTKNIFEKVWEKKYGEKTLIGRYPNFRLRMRAPEGIPTGNVISGQNTLREVGKPELPVGYARTRGKPFWVT